MYILRFVCRCPTEKEKEKERERERKLRLKIFSKVTRLGSSSSKATVARSSLEYRYFRRLSEFSIFFSTPRAASTLYARRLRSVPDLSINCKYYRVFQYWKTVADWLPITFGPTVSFSLSVVRLLFSLLFLLFVCPRRAHQGKSTRTAEARESVRTLNTQIMYVVWETLLKFH